MCGGASLWQEQPWLYLHQRVALSFVKTVFLLPEILPSPSPIQRADKQEKKLNVQTLYDTQMQLIVGNKRGHEIIHIYVV
jgi:hypothetical protein